MELRIIRTELVHGLNALNDWVVSTRA